MVNMDNVGPKRRKKPSANLTQMRAYLWAVVRDDCHGGSTNIPSTHTTNLNIPFFSHLWLVKLILLKGSCRLWDIQIYNNTVALQQFLNAEKIYWIVCWLIVENCYDPIVWPRTVNHEFSFTIRKSCSWLTVYLSQRHKFLSLRR